MNILFQQQNPTAPVGGAIGGNPTGPTAEQKEKKRKESILDLRKYLDKAIRVKFSGGREVSGILKGFDPLLNLVMDNTIEYLRGNIFIWFYIKYNNNRWFTCNVHIN